MRIFMNTILFSALLFGVTSTTFAAAGAGAGSEDAAFAALMAAVPNQRGDEEAFKEWYNILVYEDEYKTKAPEELDAVIKYKKHVAGSEASHASQAFIKACVQKLDTLVPLDESEMVDEGDIMGSLNSILPILGAKGLAVFVEEFSKCFTKGMNIPMRDRSVKTFIYTFYTFFKSLPEDFSHDNAIAVIKTLGELRPFVSSDWMLVSFVKYVAQHKKGKLNIMERIKIANIFETQAYRVVSLYRPDSMVDQVIEAVGEAMNLMPLENFPSFISDVIEQGRGFPYDTHNFLKRKLDSLRKDCVMEEAVADGAAAGAGGESSAPTSR